MISCRINEFIVVEIYLINMIFSRSILFQSLNQLIIQIHLGNYTMSQFISSPQNSIQPELNYFVLNFLTK